MKLKKKCEIIFTNDYLDTILDTESHCVHDYIEDSEEAEEITDAIRLVNKYIDLLLDNNKILSFIPEDEDDEMTIELELDDKSILKN